MGDIDPHCRLMKNCGELWTDFSNRAEKPSTNENRTDAFQVGWTI